MTAWQWVIALSGAAYYRWRDRRRERYLRDHPFSTIEETIMLSWLTTMYARYGTNEQFEACYTKWHYGVWPHQLPWSLRP